MKKIGLFILLTLLVPLTCWATVIVSFDPENSVVAPGDLFTVDLIADIEDPVLGWGLDISYDTGILSLIGAPAIGPLWTPGFAPDGDGLAGLAFPTPISGNNILLASLNFGALASGESLLQASNTSGDLTEGFPLLEPGVFADVQFVNGSVKSESVPEPATIFLAGGGLAGLWVVSRIRKSRN
jgi:hypothetical protein